MQIIDIIIKKRDGLALSREEIEFVVEGVCGGTIPEYQTSAWLMAIYLQGMNDQETAWLTTAMMNSGDVLKFPEIRKPVMDKHSTGGVGDKVSIILAPLMAACGVVMPMISGRGLGHTGGTLDKLESIPGFDVNQPSHALSGLLEEAGFFIAGQTASLVPADRTLYALRDVTGTVSSIPLIAASIMSKKLAEGLSGLVLDVKHGSGAFMKTLEEAESLARAMVGIGREVGVETRALLTSMDEPLGHAVGNALEIGECIEALQGRGPRDLMEVVYGLGQEILLMSGIAGDPESAGRLMTGKIDDESAWRCFIHAVEAQGGDVTTVLNPQRLPTAKGKKDIRASACGLSQGNAAFIRRIDAMEIARSAGLLGAGRVTLDSRIDPAVGLSDLAKIGDEVHADSLICRIHYNDETKLETAVEHLINSIELDAKPVKAHSRLTRTVKLEA